MQHPAPSTPFDVMGPDGLLRAERWGQAGQPVVVLVHGYPDNRSEWRPVAERLAARGYQVIAYDVRGAGDSFKPQGRAAYRLHKLTADFKAVIDATSPDQPVHLIGHDWGSVQGWEFATEPALAGRIASYTSCSGPCLDHAGHWLRGLLQRPTPRNLYRFGMQMIKSWYIYMFQLPWLPEAQWRGGVGRHWPTLMRWIEGVQIEPRASQVADGVHGIWLYRANVFQRMWSPRERHTQAPVHLIVPTRDRFVSPWITEDLSRWASHVQRTEIAAGHWVLIKEPAKFADILLSFLDKQPRANASHPSEAAHSSQ